MHFIWLELLFISSFHPIAFSTSCLVVLFVQTLHVLMIKVILYLLWQPIISNNLLYQDCQTPLLKWFVFWMFNDHEGWLLGLCRAGLHTEVEIQPCIYLCYSRLTSKTTLLLAKSWTPSFYDTLLACVQSVSCQSFTAIRMNLQPSLKAGTNHLLHI